MLSKHAACYKAVKRKGIRVELDESDERPGAKYYKWEMKGVLSGLR